LHERRNGKFVLQVPGHPSYGLPWGQDRLVPIFLATLAARQQCQTIRFRSAAEMLETFGMQQGGMQYRRLIASFQRIFGATIFFGTDIQHDSAAVIHQARFNFMTKARLWYARHHEQETLPGGCQNEIVLSAEFYREIITHPSPPTWTRRRHSLHSLRHWICSCGSHSVALPQRVKNELGARLRVWCVPRYRRRSGGGAPHLFSGDLREPGTVSGNLLPRSQLGARLTIAILGLTSPPRSPTHRRLRVFPAHLFQIEIGSPVPMRTVTENSRSFPIFAATITA
jgi:hypothetical protein